MESGKYVLYLTGNDWNLVNFDDFYFDTLASNGNSGKMISSTRI